MDESRLGDRGAAFVILRFGDRVRVIYVYELDDDTTAESLAANPPDELLMNDEEVLDIVRVDTVGEGGEFLHRLLCRDVVGSGSRLTVFLCGVVADVFAAGRKTGRKEGLKEARLETATPSP